MIEVGGVLGRNEHVDYRKQGENSLVFMSNTRCTAIDMAEDVFTVNKLRPVNAGTLI
jgi:hypothetical protein